MLEEIAERRVTGKEGDCLAMLVDTTTDATLARDLRGLLLAGYETTAVTLASVVEQLAHHPSALERLHDEVDANGHEYADAVVHEAMRLRPSFPFTGRRAVRDTELAGLSVRRGTMLVISVMAVHEREDVYPEPRAFRPERFLDRRPGTYTWLAFGGGPHRCIGASLALFESRILLRELSLAGRLTRCRAGRSLRARRTRCSCRQTARASCCFAGAHDRPSGRVACCRAWGHGSGHGLAAARRISREDLLLPGRGAEE